MRHTISSHASTDTHSRALTHYICLRCTFAPLRITDLLSTFGSNSGDSSELTPSKQRKSWRAITDIIGFHFNHVSGKKTCHHPEENGAKIQSLYLPHPHRRGCVCVNVQMCVSAARTPLHVRVWVLGAAVWVCVAHQCIKSQDAHTSAKWIWDPGREMCFPDALSKPRIREGQTEGQDMQVRSKNHSFSFWEKKKKRSTNCTSRLSFAAQRRCVHLGKDLQCEEAETDQSCWTAIRKMRKCDA